MELSLVNGIFSTAESPLNTFCNCWCTRGSSPAICPQSFLSLSLKNVRRVWEEAGSCCNDFVFTVFCQLLKLLSGPVGILDEGVFSDLIMLLVKMLAPFLHFLS